MNAPIHWSRELLAIAQAVLSRHQSYDDALAELSRHIGYDIPKSAIKDAFRRHGLPAPCQHLNQHLNRPIPPVELRDTERMQAAAAVELPDDSWTTVPPSRPPVEIVEDRVDQAPHERFSALVELVKKHTKRGGVILEQVCDDLDMSPRAARAHLEEARAAGITIDFAHERLLFRAPEQAPNAPAMAVSPSAGTGRDHRIAVISDLHFGSLYCLKDQFTAFVNMAYDMGVRDFFCPGDMVEGCYRHAQFERSSESLEEQQTEFLDAYPQRPGMRLFYIDGNHDFTFTEKTGVESGRNLMRMARERGRDDLHFFGSRGALIQYGETRIELWHPKKGNGYALSYQLQNKIRDTAPERLPHILFTGHTHQYVKFRKSNVWAFYSGTFQHGDAPYGRSLGGDVSMGGTILDWRIDDDGVVRELADRFHLAHHEAKRFDVAV